MWDFVIFIRDSIVSLSAMLNKFTFSISGMNITLMEIFIGFIALGMIISIFWRGARG